jgi:hypothetical protein
MKKVAALCLVSAYVLVYAQGARDPRAHASPLSPERVVADTRGAPKRDPVFVHVLPAEAPPDEHAEKAKRNAQEQEKFQLDRGMLLQTERLAFWTEALAIATALLFIFTGGLFAVARSQMKDARRAIAATEESVRVAEETAGRQLRAYVHVDARGINTVPTGVRNSHIVFVDLVLQNYGVTPAYGAQVQAYLTFHRLPFGESDVLEQPQLTGAAASSLPPGTPFPLATLTADLSQAEMDSIYSRTGALYLHGMVSYFDIYKRDRKTTSFRLYSTGKDIDTPRFAWHESGNDAT